MQPYHAGADRRALPTPDGRVQMYPCYAFEFHLLAPTIDRISPSRRSADMSSATIAAR